ncbi:protein kinase domain-containing protein [Planctomicrobium sp. SH668]|uniref:serine/threonine protein kinase n=1 Tax=Planctomicrobium sp. SH668 TaxID=3448126 RepID=UPI003F5AFBF0
MSNPSESSDSLVEKTPMPSVIGNYKILRELGSGGMGTVYLAENQETQAQVAMKVLPASMSREPGFVARFGREIKAMQELKSPHIVEFFDSGEADGTYYYTMEYVDGETLTSRLKREKRIPWREAIEIATQICKALKSAHNCGIIHRDLKPSNLLLAKDGSVKLTDFGIAQLFASTKLTVTGGILGTAEYMSPEQAQGHRATRQSDIYSLGAVLYVMLTGRPPFTGKTTLDIIQKHRFNQFDSPRRIVADIPFWLDEIVCQCLAKKPEARYPDAYVLMLRLQEVPKKVDLKASDELDNPATHGEDVTQGHTQQISHEHIGGTFVRDIFREQLTNTHTPTVVGRFLDNVWVLLGLLLVLVIGVVGAMRWNKLSQEQMFARGEQLMQQPEGNQWDVAKSEFFDPLMELDSEKWGPKIDPYLADIQMHQIKKQTLGRHRKKDPAPKSEPEAVIRQALDLRKLGKLGEARAKLAAFSLLAAENSELSPYAAIATQLQNELLEEEVAGRLNFVEQALLRADALLEANDISAATEIWRSVLELYDADPSARKFVEIARQKLASHETD